MRSAACNAGVELRAMYPGECHDVTHVTQGTSGLTTELFLLLVVSRDLSFTLSDDLRCDGWTTVVGYHGASRSETFHYQESRKLSVYCVIIL